MTTTLDPWIWGGGPYAGSRQAAKGPPWHPALFQDGRAMDQDRTASARASVQRLCRRLGLPAEIELCREANNVVFFVGDALVAKAATGRSRREVAHEARVLEALRGANAPAVAGADEGAGPWEQGDWSVLLTKRLVPVREVKEGEAVESLRRLHESLRDLAIDGIEDWSQIPRQARQVWEEHPFSGAEQQGMELAFERWVEPAMRLQHDGAILHGDAWSGQVVAASEGLRWLDFEAVCRGPVEWDLTSFDDVRGYGAHDSELRKVLQIVTSWCIAIWCNQGHLSNVERDEARDVHLGKVIEAVRG